RIANWSYSSLHYSFLSARISMSVRVWFAAVVVTIVAAAGLEWLHASDDAKPAAAPTYSRDVAPLVQRNCQLCHRPGEAGPLPMLNYRQGRARAPAVQVAGGASKLPPWVAARRYGPLCHP